VQIGMQVIIEDYIHAPAMKVSPLIANTGFLTAIGVSGAAAFLKITFAQ
jgi:succinate dehydrogenase / fumarate reductase, membrane anchor subunit